MRITGLNNNLSSGRASNKTQVKSGEFSDELSASSANSNDESTSASVIISTPPAQVVSSIEALAALAPSVSRSESKQANKLLDALEELKMALLVGRIPESTLQNLTEISQSIPRENIKNSKLIALLDEIDLRAQVEVAKYQRHLAG